MLVFSLRETQSFNLLGKELGYVDNGQDIDLILLIKEISCLTQLSVQFADVFRLILGYFSDCKCTIRADFGLYGLSASAMFNLSSALSVLNAISGRILSVLCIEMLLCINECQGRDGNAADMVKRNCRYYLTVIVDTFQSHVIYELHIS